MKKTVPLLALAALALASLDARAQVSSTLTLASDYDFRGISQTARDPALQASLDYSAPSGLYLGAWASNVDYGPGTDADLEIDGLVGFRGNFNDDTTFDLGAVYYYFWEDGDDVAFVEPYVGIGYKAVSARLWYAPDFSNSGESATYIEANATLPLPADFGLTLHAGYSDGDYWDAVNGGGYLDYAIGVSKTVGKFALALKWVDGSDLESSDGTPGDVFTSESKLWFSVATTLPW
jgi:uncharacterized protein (TIGR02001 family)